MVTGSILSNPNSPLLHCATQFKNDIHYTTNALKELRKYRIEIRSGIHVHLDNRKIELYVCLYFLKIHLSWEAFLESTLLRYICGHSSPSGNSPRLLISKQTSIANALSTILGGKNYLVWSPDEVINRTQRYLYMGEPYSSAISTAKHELTNIYVIRNRIAHRSEYAQNNFRQLIRSEIGYNPRGMTPGRFLMMKKAFSGTRKKITYLDYYLYILQSLCNHIVS
jgi:hypothetical protein